MAEGHHQKNDEENRCIHCGKTYQYYQYLVLHLRGCSSRGQTSKSNDRISENEGDIGTDGYESDSDDSNGENEEGKKSISASDYEKSSANKQRQQHDLIELSSDNDDDSTDNPSNAASLGTGAHSTITYDLEQITLDNSIEACEEAKISAFEEEDLELDYASYPDKNGKDQDVADNERWKESVSHSEGIYVNSDPKATTNRPKTAINERSQTAKGGTGTNKKREKSRNKKQHICSICMREFSIRSRLNRHSLVHTGIKAHECPVCGNKFARKDVMQRHARARHYLNLTQRLMKKACRRKMPQQQADIGVDEKNKGQEVNIKNEDVISQYEEEEEEDGEIEEEVDDVYEAECAAEDEEDESYNLMNKDVLEGVYEEVEQEDGREIDERNEENGDQKEVEENDGKNKLELILQERIHKREVGDEERDQEEKHDQEELDEKREKYEAEEEKQIGEIMKEIVYQNDMLETKERQKREASNSVQRKSSDDDEGSDEGIVFIQKVDKSSRPIVKSSKVDDCSKYNPCDKRFSYPASMKRHTRNKMCTKNCASKRTNNNKKLFVCTECGKSLKSRISLKRHISLHTGKRPHPCLICGLSFLYKSDLGKHKTTQSHKEKELNTKLCDKGNMLQQHNDTSLESTKKHAVSHCRIKKFQCDICTKTFLTNDVRSKHIRNVHRGLPYKCSSCHKQFAYNFEIKSHECRPSSKETKHTLYEPDAQSQIVNVNLVGDSYKMTGKTDTKISPKVAAKNEDNISQITEIEKRIANRTNTQTITKRTKQVEPQDGQHVCPICYKELARRQNLIHHIRIHYQAEQHKCNNCMKRFVYHHSLIRHLKLKVCRKNDSGNKRKEFLSKRKIDIETASKNGHDAAKKKVLKSNTHTSERHTRNEASIKSIKKSKSEKRFRCDVCEKSYAHNESLIRHSKLHKTAANTEVPRDKKCIIGNQTENSDFQDKDRRKDKASKSDAIHECSTCKKKFSRRTHLERHQLLHLNIRPFKCSECPMKFTRKDSLKGHVRNIHGTNVRDQCNDKFKARISTEKKIFSKKIKAGNSHNENETMMMMRNKLREKSCKDDRIPEKHLTCDICNKQFRGKDRKQYFWTHVIQNHTGIKPFKCNRCPTRFSCSRYLKAHMKRVHGNASSA